MLEIRKSAINGQGVFATQVIPRGSFITTLTGELLTVKDTQAVCQSRGICRDDPLQITADLNLLLHPLPRTFNHSCSPNAGLRHSHHLYALREIAIGQEITYDYATTVGKADPWVMPCHCGSSACRESVSNIAHIPKERVEEYLALDLLPAFIKYELALNKKAQPALPATEESNLEHYLKAAKAFNLPLHYKQQQGFLDLYLAKHKYTFSQTKTPFNDAANSALANNFEACSSRLRQLGLPVVTQLTITQKAYREGIWPLPAFDYPQILRPALEQNHEVYERIYSIERLLTLLEENLSYRESVTLQKFAAGLHVHRVLVFFKRIVSVVHLKPLMTKAGNELEVVAASISPENLALFQQAAGALDLKVVGFEVLCEDLLQPLSSSCGGITKVDAEPSLQLYAAPDGEAAADLAALFLRRLLRQHPIAYLKAYLKTTAAPYRLYYRSLFALGLLLGLVNYLRNF